MNEFVEIEIEIETYQMSAIAQRVKKTNNPQKVIKEALKLIDY